MEQKNQELLRLESQIKEIEVNIQNLEYQISDQKMKSPVQDVTEGKRETNEMMNSYIDSIMEGQGSIAISNPSFQLTVTGKGKDLQYKQEKACLCTIF